MPDANAASMMVWPSANGTVFPSIVIVVFMADAPPHHPGR